MYDYIIVGGGSAGCVLANRLSKNPNTKVCLVEAGPADKHPLIHLPVGMVWMMLSKRLNWQYFTEPQSQLKNRKLFWPRGKTLGGSSSSNAMIYTRGHATDYDEWAKLGNTEWNYKKLLPIFLRNENRERGHNPFRGTGGPLQVSENRSKNTMCDVFINAAQEKGFPVNHDFSGASQEGVGYYELTQKNGYRFSAAKAYLRPVMDRSNLTVITKARTTKVRFDGKRAVGITYQHGNKTIDIDCSQEVILSSGAINSPQLLMLSGVGPKNEIEKHGINLIHELPGVGQNLQDHLDVLIVQRSKTMHPITLGPMALVKSPIDIFNFFFKRRGAYTTNGAEAGGFVKTSADEAIPDIQFHYTPALLDNHARNLKFMMRHGYSLHVCNLRPKSRGYIGLRNADPTSHAVIQPNYLSHPDDIQVMVKGVKTARSILAASAYDNYRGKEIFPGNNIQTDKDIEGFIRQKAETIYHPVGTCKMGHDDMAVVDQQLRVHGLEGIRVIDASIMPTLIGGNTNAPTMVIAEKAADFILNENQTTQEGESTLDKAIGE